MFPQKAQLYDGSEEWSDEHPDADGCSHSLQPYAG